VQVSSYCTCSFTVQYRYCTVIVGGDPKPRH
jgi:hypothetical protein